MQYRYYYERVKRLFTIFVVLFLFRSFSYFMYTPLDFKTYASSFFSTFVSDIL